MRTVFAVGNPDLEVFDTLEEAIAYVRVFTLVEPFFNTLSGAALNLIALEWIREFKEI